MIVKNFGKLASQLRKFLRDADGSVNIEAIILMPVLLLTMAVSMVFYDAFRRDSMGEKATYTLGDMLSRETAYITPAYVDSAKDLFGFLTGTGDADNTIRVSVVSYDGPGASYNVEWSEVRGAHAMTLTDAELAGQHDQLPVMVSGEQLIVVETYVDYDWPLELGFNDGVLTARVFTRPRFAPQLVWLGS
ncbi:TadE/TadG family type IV pilus assembly protein [Marinovum algicola]|uniref:TadE/TadG family type IV pilus assembly protein n=1 Tax=Marinovum algicola TaxID=42444 RepID=UPI0024B9F106|nr:hypothetical protein [Marinovum algicola]